MKKETLVIFDFDGTITNKDTMLDMAKWYFGAIKFYFGLCIILPHLLLHKAGIISNTKAKERFLSYFYGGMSYDFFQEKCRKYSLTMIDRMLKKEAMRKIKFYKDEGFKMIIVTASAVDWVAPWAFKNGFFDILGSKLESKNNKLTGKLGDKNCYGIEKVNALITKYGPFENYHIIAYGDSNGDKELLLRANQSFYKKYE